MTGIRGEFLPVILSCLQQPFCRFSEDTLPDIRYHLLFPQYILTCINTVCIDKSAINPISSPSPFCYLQLKLRLIACIWALFFFSFDRNSFNQICEWR